jgi:hypothetical protein
VFVPKSGLVNTDIAKLNNYFKGKVPENIDCVATTFKTIIDNFDRETSTTRGSFHGNPAKRLLQDNPILPITFPRKEPSCTHDKWPV